VPAYGVPVEGGEKSPSGMGWPSKVPVADHVLDAQVLDADTVKAAASCGPLCAASSPLLCVRIHLRCVVFALDLLLDPFSCGKGCGAKERALGSLTGKTRIKTSAPGTP